MNKLLYQEALDVAGSYDVASPKNSVVLYSISYLPTTENRDKAFAYVKKHPRACMIEDTACGKKLLEMGVGYHEVGLSQDEIAQIWSIASRRFISSVKGEIVAFVDKADARSVFRMVELPMLLENPEVTKINKMNKYQFAAQFKD